MSPDSLELWAPVAEAPAYEVSTWGRVRRGEFDVATWPNKKGYAVVNLEVPGRDRPVLRYVHRLVLAAFDRPPVGELANHADGIKANNWLENLEWTTPSGNVEHAWRLGLMPRTRAPRLQCRYGHPLTQTYQQRDRHGVLRTWWRCARCRRARRLAARARAMGLRSLFDDASTEAA